MALTAVIVATSAVAPARIGVAVAAPLVGRDHLLAFEHTRAGVFLERLDARTLRPLTDKPKFVLVARRFPIEWDLSPDGSELIVASDKARIVDLATFSAHTQCCLPLPVTSPDFAALLWTAEGVEVIDDGGDTWDLNGGGNTLNAPYELADFAKGPTGLVELYSYQEPGAPLSWALTENTSAAAPADIPELTGESTVAMAVDGNRIELLTPAGSLTTVTQTGNLTRSIALPPAPATASGFGMTAWSPGRLVVSTANELVLVQAQSGVSKPLRRGATSFITGASDLVVWSASRPKDGLFVYDRTGNLRLRLLAGVPIGCVTLHNRFAYVAQLHGKGCSTTRTILDLQTGHVIGHGTAPGQLIG